MFEFLFKYPASVFGRGTVVLLGGWPRSVLFTAMAVAALALAAVFFWRRSRLRSVFQGWRAAVIWGLQSALVALLLLLLWQPAISITSLRPQENIVAVLADDSRSMGLSDGGSGTREEQLKHVLDSSLLRRLRDRFQVRLYSLDASAHRISDTTALQANGRSTQIGKALRQIADEAGTLPIGSLVLLTDGADNTGGIDAETMTELRRRRLPVNTVGFGADQLKNDIELDGVDLASKTLPGSRLRAEVTVRQNGFSGKRARLSVVSGGVTLASRELLLADRPEQTEDVEFNAGAAGVKNIEFRLQPLNGETNLENDRRTQVLLVDSTKRRLLYVEGEPRWEYKFLRRAVEDDPALSVVSMLRTTVSKVYRQGISNPNELADGFPSKPEELFEYQGLILGSIEAAYFTPGQQQLIRDFVDRRGGGLLALAGASSLADGGYGASGLADLLPVTLPSRKNTFQRNFVAAELTDAGRSSLLCRVDDDADKSIKHWEVLPYLANYQDPGVPKPGATVLLRVAAEGKQLPLLITENYGLGRSAVFATAGSWRWRMQQPVADKSQETFWKQLLRSVVSATPSRVAASTRVAGSTKDATLEDEDRMQLRAEVRDTVYQLTSNADVQAHIVKPDGSADTVALRPEPQGRGIYSIDWNAAQPGSYAVQITALKDGKTLGEDTLSFRREEGVAENFHREQNRDLLQHLAQQTGGRYYTPGDANRLSDEIAYSEAGVTSREFKDLWNMPIVFLLVVLLKSSEWLLRRRWGTV